MNTLQLEQSTTGNAHEVRLTLQGEGLPTMRARASFAFELTPQDRGDIRWYLEDYLQHPLDPAPQIAARIEARMVEIGRELFQNVFQGNDAARDLWARVRDSLHETRVEVFSEVREAASIPWELLRDHRTDTPLALQVPAFVRTHLEAPRFQMPEEAADRVRILLVICRPREREDVPFRSVASRLLKGLGEQARELFQLDVLRPPTYEQLARALRAARAAGRPYHIVHFDGHGTYIDAPEPSRIAEILNGLGSLLLSGVQAGAHGYLMFENPELEDNVELLDGQRLGDLLYETGVPVLVLNACRSAHAEAPEAPEAPEGERDVQEQVRGFGSLAQEVIDKGVAGVVAMRYNVYVVTAAQFVANLYGALAAGHSLGEAVTLGRKNLADNPLRTIAYDPVPLQDWPVPVVYETAPIQLFPRRAEAEGLMVTLESGQATPGRGTLVDVPPPPDAGFFGRDETLLALDRAFDGQRVVLLHAYAGSGKTATAAEFARWYSQTGGVEGPVLFTSFQQHMPLPRVLDAIGRVFGPALEQAGVQWLALPDEARRDVALQVMRQVPVLWIWDNVEPVAGFPAGTESAWTAEEQRELADFLREAANTTRARFLLTSRREERDWLGDLPRRIRVPAMPMQERVELTKALAERHGHRITDVADWRPLLAFTRGNPLTITVLVGQALRQGLRTREHIQAFVEALQAGEAVFQDAEESEGRDRSLGASLSYGFGQAFTEAERRILALLHLFQGFVDVQVLRVMVNPTSGDWGLPGFKDFTEVWGTALLDRAAEIGLLTAHGDGYYSIHPALPWYFRRMFETHYGAPERLQAARAYVEAIGELGVFYTGAYVTGHRDVIDLLAAEEANLLYARRLARERGWWGAVIGTMQGLRTLYGQRGRRSEWRRRVEEITPDFVDGATDGPLPGREAEWSLVTEYRVGLAMEQRDWAAAERLQRLAVAWNRQRAAPLLNQPAEALDAAGRNAIRSLAVSLELLGHILREQGRDECVAVYEEAIPLCQRIGDKPEEAIVCFNLGHAFKDLPTLRDLNRAEDWYRRSLELHDARDRLGRGKCLNQLGAIACERFREAREVGRPEEELLEHLTDAARLYHWVLELLPPDAVDSRAVAHNQLGFTYGEAGQVDRALHHFRESIRLKELAGNIYAAGTTRYNVGLALARAGRLEDALLYARQALDDFRPYGAGAAQDIQDTQRLIGRIEEDLRRRGEGR